MAADDALVAALCDVVGASHVVTDASVRASYETDWTGRWTGHARCVVRPADTDEVSRVLSVCADHGATVVPQGGNTGLVGGGVPRGGEVVVSTARLDELGAVDVDQRQVTAGAGVRLARLQAHAASAGLAYGVDLAARDTATIGGTVATDAGGIRVVRYGTTRDQVVGLTAVLADGSIVHGGVHAADVAAAGALLATLVGSEGTLAILTRIRVRLVAPTPHRAVLLLALADVPAALEAQASVRSACADSGVHLEASELMTATGLALVVASGTVRAPWTELPPVALLLEVGGEEEVAGVATELAGRLLEAVEGVQDLALATDAPERRRLWQLREAHTETLAAQGRVHKLDVVLPPEAIAGFLASLPTVVAAARSGSAAARSAPAAAGPAPAAARPPATGGMPGRADAEVVVFGHLGVGDLHVNLLGLADTEVAAVEGAVLHAVIDAGGRPDGEHGVGVHKPAWVARSRSAGELELLRATARRLDPDGRMNPGVLLPP